VRVVSTSCLPIDLGAQLAPVGATADVPATWVGVDAVALEHADALVCLLLDRIDAAALARAPTLRVIANCAVGVDNIDLAAATRAGVPVTNTPDVLTEATAELAIALMFAAARRLPEADDLVRGGRWEGWRLDQLLGVQLAGKLLAVIGPGRIGRATAVRARALGMRVLEVGVGDDVGAALAAADVVSLHCPLTPATRGLIGAAALARMKSTAIVINTARGACVDTGALVDALDAGRLFAAGLDVFPDEPRIDPRLVACRRAVLAPHIGSATTETRTRMAQLCADAVIAVLTGRRPGNVVNPEVYARG
jgi:glyoxylate reductase